MNTVFNLCKLLIDRGRTDGLQEKMDVYLASLHMSRSRPWSGLS